MTENRSPHQLDLRRPPERRAAPKGVNDVVAPIGSSTKKIARRIPDRVAESLRMSAIGLLVIFMLNAGGVYTRGLDLKEEIATAAIDGVESLRTQGFGPQGLQQVQSALNDVRSKLWFVNDHRGVLLANGQTADATAELLEIGEQLSRAGERAVEFAQITRTLAPRFFTPKRTGVSVTNEWREAYDEHFVPAVTLIREAESRLSDIRAGLFPPEVRAAVEAAQSGLATARGLVEKADMAFPLVLQLLGDEHPQRVLILLENNNESRPGGGFIGSYMVAELNDGHVGDLEFRDVYELDNRFHEDIEPPAEIDRLTNNWRFRDSNTSPDLSVSAEQARWFLEKQGGPGVDHVLTVDLDFVAGLLEVTGPIKIDSLPLPLAADNFALVLSYLVESKWAGRTTPKQVLKEFIDAVQVRLRDQMPWKELASLTQDMAALKHVSLNAKDKKMQTLFEEFGLTGVLPKARKGEDVSMVVHTLLGSKTDRTLEQSIRHEAQIEDNGHIVDRLTIHRRHAWDNAEQLRVRNLLAGFGFPSIEPWLMDILGSAPNNAVLRVYVPHGSKLLGAEGLAHEAIERHYDAALNLDYFAFNSTLYPGEASTVSLTYELPFTLEFDPLQEYRLTFMKQPGDRTKELSLEVHEDARVQHYRSFPEGWVEDPDQPGSYGLTLPFTGDVQTAYLLGR